MITITDTTWMAWIAQVLVTLLIAAWTFKLVAKLIANGRRHRR